MPYIGILGRSRRNDMSCFGAYKVGLLLRVSGKDPSYISGERFTVYVNWSCAIIWSFPGFSQVCVRVTNWALFAETS